MSWYTCEKLLTEGVDENKFLTTFLALGWLALRILERLLLNCAVNMLYSLCPEVGLVAYDLEVLRSRSFPLKYIKGFFVNICLEFPLQIP